MVLMHPSQIHAIKIIPLLYGSRNYLTFKIITATLINKKTKIQLSLFQALNTFNSNESFPTPSLFLPSEL
jgi:hypothetical protein